MRLYITIQRSDADDLGPFEDGIDAQASVKLYDELLMENVECVFYHDNVEIEWANRNGVALIAGGMVVIQKDLEDELKRMANDLYKTPDRWLVKKEGKS